MNEEDRRLIAHARLRGMENLSRNDRWRVEAVERNEQRALARAEEQRAQQQTEIMLATSDEHSRLQDEIVTLRGELDGLRSDVVTGLKAVGEGFDHITDTESEHAAERERALQDEISVLSNELAAVRAEGMERTAKATIAVFGEIAAQRAAMDQLIDTEREKNAQTLSLAAEREEKVCTLQDEVSALRNELTVVRVEAAEKLAKNVKASLEAFTEVANQRAAVARLVDTAREELDSLNARTVSLAADMKELKEAAQDFIPRKGRQDARPASLPARAGT